MAPGGDKWLEVRGSMDEPVQGISEIQLSVWANAMKPIGFKAGSRAGCLHALKQV